MPPTLFDRRVRLLVASPLKDDFGGISTQFVEVTDLDISFKVTKDNAKEPNKCEVTVYNLAERTRAGMQKKGSKLVLSAGYRDALAQIFVGDCRVIDHRHDGPNWVTKLEAGDGERGWLHGRVSESFRPGTRARDVVKKLAEAAGWDASVVDSVDWGGAQYKNGHAAHGRASRSLDEVLRGLGFEWSVQDGKLAVQKPGQAGTLTVTVLSADSGLVGTPEYSTPEKLGAPPVLKVRALISPDMAAILPGGMVKLDTRLHKGVHVVKKVEHTGDTAGGDWYTDLEVDPEARK